MLAGISRRAAALGHRCVTYEQDGKIIGFAYFAPAPMTDRTWDLWWIVVSKQIQARGIGGELLRFAEDAARAEKGRLMMVPTSGCPTYELTRRFYLKHGYEVARRAQGLLCRRARMVLSANVFDTAKMNVGDHFKKIFTFLSFFSCLSPKYSLNLIQPLISIFVFMEAPG